LDWNVCEFQNENLDEMIKITVENYGKIEIADKSFLQWQYFDNPAGNALIKLAKSSQNEVVGQYIIIPMKIKFNDEIIYSTLSLNTLTRKDYRGKGIFVGLADAIYSKCKEGKIRFTYGFPNQNSYPGFIKKLQFQDLGSIPLLVRPLSVKKLLFNKFNSKLLANVGGLLQPIFNTSVKDSEEIKIMRITSKFEDFDEFWKSIKDKYKVIGVRNSEYIKWRYSDIPIREYYIIGAYRNEELIAYSILRNTEIEKYRCGMIVDFMIKDGEKLAGKKIINEAINQFKKEGIELAGCLMLPNTEEYQILKANRFLKCPKFLEPQPFKIIYRNHHDNNNEQLENINNWFLTMGDYDVI